MKKSLALLFMTLFWLSTAKAQFTYINANVGYKGLSLKTDLLGANTGSKSFSASFSIVSRFKRHFGVGVKVALPLSQSSEFSFKDALTSSGNTFSDREVTDPSSRYYAHKYDYAITQSAAFSLFGRVYFDKLLNSHVDISVSYLRLEESFQFKRPAQPAFNDYGYHPSLPEKDIDYTQTHKIITPGIKLGLSPHITDQLYLDFNMGFDFLVLQKNDGFKYTIAYDYDVINDWDKYVNFESQVEGVKLLFSIDLGIGYYF